MEREEENDPSSLLEPNSSSFPSSQTNEISQNLQLPIKETGNLERENQSTSSHSDPMIGMAFETETSAFNCYNEYAKKIGFTVRWDNRTLSRRTGVTLARRFVCSKQGRRGDGQRKRHSQAKYHREETRCGCLAYMKIKLSSDGKYRIIELNATHNHPLSSQVPFNYALANIVLYNHPTGIPIPNIRPSNPVPYNRPVAVFLPISPQQVHSHSLGGKNSNSQHPGQLMLMQRFHGGQSSISGKTRRKRKSLVVADDTEKQNDELSRASDHHVNEEEVLESLSIDLRNYLPAKRTHSMTKSDVDSLLDYLRRKQVQNPSFLFSFQLDTEEKITNVFWMDGKMKTDYARFGDVICFDTTYKIHDYGRPIVIFVGINHHKQIVIFGAGLIYDDSGYSYKWIFSTFLKAVGCKRPKTILTDDNSSILAAVSSEFGDISHRLCAWHMYQNSTKNLSKVFTGSKDFEEDFARCIYNHEVEEEFIKVWNSTLEKYNLTENSWLKQRFRERERWAPAYGKAVFCGDIHNAQHRERMTKELRRHLSSSKDLAGFLQGFEKLLDDRRTKEIETNNKMIKNSPYAPPVSIIQQAARVYTTAAFDMFMAEYIAGLECLVRERNYDGSMQLLTVEDGCGYKHKVKVNFEEEMMSCSCSKFDQTGVLCGHILTCITKKLRSIPEKYILRRWTRSAGNMMLMCETDEIGDEREVDVLSHRYTSLVHDFMRIAVRAGEDEEIYSCVLKHKEAMAEEMDKVLKEKNSSLSYHLFGEHVW